MPSSVRGQLYGTVNLQCELLSVVQVRSPFFSDAKARFPVDAVFPHYLFQFGDVIM